MFGLHGYLTMRGVCSLTTLSESTIRRRVREGRFPKPVKIPPRRIVFVKKEVYRWLALRDEWRPEDEPDGRDF